MQSKWPGFLPGHFILLSLRPFITIQTTKQLNILYIFSSFSPLPQVPPCFKTVICYNCYFEKVFSKNLLVFPYFLCTFAQIELLTHAYDAHQQYST